MDSTELNTCKICLKQKAEHGLGIGTNQNIPCSTLTLEPLHFAYKEKGPCAIKLRIARLLENADGFIATTISDTTS